MGRVLRRGSLREAYYAVAVAFDAAARAVARANANARARLSPAIVIAKRHSSRASVLRSSGAEGREHLLELRTVARQAPEVARDAVVVVVALRHDPVVDREEVVVVR
jgi:hypothetical protein